VSDAAGDGRDPAAPRLPSAPSALPPELVAELRTAIVDARVAAEQRAAYAPLRDLADALKANAAALESVQATQERIARAVDRSDRSDAVVQSTQALNETFRGVRAAQEALVGRLDREERRPLRAAALAAGLVLVAGGLAAWLFLGRDDALERRLDALREEFGPAATAAREASFRAAEKELQDRLAALASKEGLTAAERAAAAAETERLRGSLEALKRENDALEGRREELLRLQREYAALEGRARAAEDERDGLRRAEAEARRALAEKDEKIRLLEARPAVAATPASAPPASPAPSPSDPVPAPQPAATGPAPPASPASPALPAGSVTDPAQVARLVETLNPLLDLGRTRGDLYRVISARGVDGDRLLDPRIELRNRDGKLLRSFEATEVRFVLVPSTATLEIRMKSGAIVFPGRGRSPFPSGSFTAYLGLDAVAVRATGHPLIAQP
jgi:hypothetical protein